MGIGGGMQRGGELAGLPPEAPARAAMAGAAGAAVVVGVPYRT